MKKNDHRILRWLLLVAAVVLLYACSDDAPDTPDTNVQRHTEEVELRPYVPWFIEDVAQSRTRSFPGDYSGYKDYAALYGEDGNFKYQTDLSRAIINIYFTKAGTTLPTTEEFAEIQYSPINKVWGSSFNIEAGTDYYLYGFIPKGVAELGSEIAPNANFEDGAVLTLKKLNTITYDDVCVVVAAGRGDDETGPNSGYGIGKFKYESAPAGVTGKNFVYLLFDHLFASLRFNIMVVSSYDNLRTIKLKKLQMQSDNMKKYVDATITLTANSTGASPMSVSFSSTNYPDDVFGDDDGTLFPVSGSDDEPVTLSPTPSSFLGCFLPGGEDKFKLVSTYDVYDKAGNLIRENCKASNAIVLSKFAPSLSRGKMVAINLTVNPTYLYMLSEPDLENPTVTIN